MTLSLVLTGNEPRQRYLFEALGARARVHATVPFDDIDPITKSLAAALSFAWPRSEWWENYHMHPLVQRRRCRVLARGMQNVKEEIDALLMWGSWFQPQFGSSQKVPFFNYIDQSRSLANLPGELVGRFSRRRKSHQMQSRTYEHSSGIFCMSQWARTQTLEAHRVGPEKVTAVGWGPCGVDLSSEDLSEGSRENIVLHISNDFYRKGADFLIETAARVRQAIPDVQFVVIGSDSGGMQLPQTSREVRFLGRITDKGALAQYFRRARVFFLPHRFDRSPHVLVEAMSAALPLVASAQGGAIELIQDQQTGFLCQSGDVAAYADALITLLRDEDLRAKMGARAKALMRAKYNWDAVSANILDRIARTVVRSAATAPCRGGV